MKKIIFYVFTIAFLWNGIFCYAGSNTGVYQVQGTPFTLTVKTFLYKKRNCDQPIKKYQYYLTMTPNSAHKDIPRLEYVGYRLKVGNSASYYQIFPDGTHKRLTDASKVLYSPSRVAMQPSDNYTYQLLQEPVASGGCEGNLEQIDFVAGYGFLTNSDLALVDQQQETQRKALEMNIEVIPADKTTTMWSIAQGNMFKYETYYNVLTLTFDDCPDSDPGRR